MGEPVVAVFVGARDVAVRVPATLFAVRHAPDGGADVVLAKDLFERMSGHFALRNWTLDRAALVGWSAGGVLSGTTLTAALDIPIRLPPAAAHERRSVRFVDGAASPGGGAAPRRPMTVPMRVIRDEEPGAERVFDDWDAATPMCRLVDLDGAASPLPLGVRLRIESSAFWLGRRGLLFSAGPSDAVVEEPVTLADDWRDGVDVDVQFDGAVLPAQETGVLTLLRRDRDDVQFQLDDVATLAGARLRLPVRAEAVQAEEATLLVETADASFVARIVVDGGLGRARMRPAPFVEPHFGDTCAAPWGDVPMCAVQDGGLGGPPYYPSLRVRRLVTVDGEFRAAAPIRDGRWYGLTRRPVDGRTPRWALSGKPGTHWTRPDCAPEAVGAVVGDSEIGTDGPAWLRLKPRRPSPKAVAGVKFGDEEPGAIWTFVGGGRFDCGKLPADEWTAEIVTPDGYGTDATEIGTFVVSSNGATRLLLVREGGRVVLTTVR